MMLFTLSFLTMKFTMENHAHQCGVVIGFSLLWYVLAFFSIYTVNRAEPVRAKFNLRAGRSPKRSTRIQIKKNQPTRFNNKGPYHQYMEVS